MMLMTRGVGRDIRWGQNVLVQSQSAGMLCALLSFMQVRQCLTSALHK
jgi:hypothetical protein